jgi:hypothetical protein
MTAKKRAVELVFRFRKVTPIESSWASLHYAKECAIDRLRKGNININKLDIEDL